MHELPSVALTTRLLALCQEYGAERLAVSIVGAERSTAVPGLPLPGEQRDEKTPDNVLR